MAEGVRDWLNAWADYRAEAEEYRELDGECVLVLVCFSGRGKTSGLELGLMKTEAAELFHMRDGKVRKLVRYLDRDRAVADLGLKE
jgi:ketosteroid isomerase-like protein